MIFLHLLITREAPEYSGAICLRKGVGPEPVAIGTLNLLLYHCNALGALPVPAI